MMTRSEDLFPNGKVNRIDGAVSASSSQLFSHAQQIGLHRSAVAGVVEFLSYCCFVGMNLIFTFLCCILTVLS